MLPVDPLDLRAFGLAEDPAMPALPSTAHEAGEEAFTATAAQGDPQTAHLVLATSSAK
jgi:hypothetical protein